MDSEWCHAVLQVGQDNKRRGQKYLCSNPNCKQVFSRPKIIKYHVCPTCQTLVNMNAVADQKDIQFALATKSLLKRRKPKVVKRDNPEEPSAMNAQTPVSQPKVEELCIPEKKTETSEQIIAPEQIRVPTNLETLIPATTQQAEEVKTKTVSTSSPGCQYGFGYLHQREKGERIPDACIECAKSLDCMLSEYRKTEESVKEIKKWYNF